MMHEQSSDKEDSHYNVEDQHIVRASIHPGIGIARIGDSKEEFLIGPEVTEPTAEPSGYRDKSGALKRQAAQFRIYGLNSAGQVVREITYCERNIVIEWTVHIANKKAQWYRYQEALDLPENIAMSVPRRNSQIPFAQRSILAIDPGSRSIKGINVSGGNDHSFNTGTFKGVVVPLGEIRTDSAGRLRVLGGSGQSASPSGAPVFSQSDAQTFLNADDWYDDTSDGPVTATVTIDGRAIPVEPAWVVVAPPNFAPQIVGWRTMYDILLDVYIRAGLLSVPDKVSFTRDVFPILRRLSNLQWVNKGFAAMFGAGGPMDFDNPDFVARLSQTLGPNHAEDPYQELRLSIKNAFRTDDAPDNEPQAWPWIYGDQFEADKSVVPKTRLALSNMQTFFLNRWANGDFVNDWQPGQSQPKDLADVPLSLQPEMLDRAALHFCLADAFHPGCEMTWPMRHASMYSAPFRIRQRNQKDIEPDYGTNLTAQIAQQTGGPLYAQGPGDITRWMSLPWQADTAFCRSGYDHDYDPYLPTFWAARVPNHVLSEEDYKVVVDLSKPRPERIVAFNRRNFWWRFVSIGSDFAVIMQAMIKNFGQMGIVEARAGVKGDPLFPETLFVEKLGPLFEAMAAAAQDALQAQPARELSASELRLHRAGWESEEQLATFRKVRFRRQR